MNRFISIFSFNTLYKILKPLITCILWNNNNHNHNNNDGKSQNWCNNTWKIGFQNTRKPTTYFHKILFNLCIVWPKTIKWTNVFFFCGITFKIRSKLPLMWLLDHKQLWYIHEWLASSAQVTSLLQRPLLSQT